LWQIETFVTFCGMVRLRVVAGEGLRSVGAAPTSPIQERVLYLAPRSLFIRPGDPSEVSISRPLAERREMVDVALGTNILGFPKAAYDVGIDGPRTEIVVDGYEDDTYEDVAWQICRALAVLGFRGEVRLFCDAGAEEEEKWEIFASVSHLKGVLHLTDDYAACASGSSKSPRPARSLSELVGVWATMPRSFLSFLPLFNNVLEGEFCELLRLYGVSRKVEGASSTK
jgi:hypothetical protein